MSEKLESLRAEFEAVIRKVHPNAKGAEQIPLDELLKRLPDGRYALGTMRCRWEGYQLRAMGWGRKFKVKKNSEANNNP